MFQERLRSQKTQGVVTPKPEAKQAEKPEMAKGKRTNKGSGSEAVKAVAGPRKRAKKSGSAGGQ